MFSFESIPKIYLACQPVDFRKGIDGFAAIIQSSFQLDPFQDALFIFTNRSHNKIKCLYYDKNGFWLLYKRLNKGSFPWRFKEDGTVSISHNQLSMLLGGIDICPKDNFKEDRPRYI